MARKKGREIHGWLIVDKPAGIGSTDVVSRVRWALDAKKAGHAGTLDPDATGVLAVALGEATKTVPILTDALKAYDFTVNWGAETATDDASGEVLKTSAARPSDAEIRAALPAFTGDIMQVPPNVSAVRVDGARAYDLAREGEVVELAARPLWVDSLELLGVTADTADLRMVCGKGGYVRAIARDLGRTLGCLGHVAHLRRTRVGPFTVDDSASVETLRESPESALTALQPVKAALTLIPEIVLHRDAAARLKRGQSALLRGAGAPIELEAAYATCAGTLVSTGSVQNGEFVPHRVFNL